MINLESRLNEIEKNLTALIKREEKASRVDIYDLLAEIRVPLIVIILVIMCGLLGYLAIPHIPDENGEVRFGLLDSLYMTIYTITTTGHGDLNIWR